MLHIVILGFGIFVQAVPARVTLGVTSLLTVSTQVTFIPTIIGVIITINVVNIVNVINVGKVIWVINPVIIENHQDFPHA